jgi:hypothetical protein
MIKLLKEFLETRELLEEYVKNVKAVDADKEDLSVDELLAYIEKEISPVDYIGGIFIYFAVPKPKHTSWPNIEDEWRDLLSRTTKDTGKPKMTLQELTGMPSEQLQIAFSTAPTLSIFFRFLADAIYREMICTKKQDYSAKSIAEATYREKAYKHFLANAENVRIDENSYVTVRSSC